MVAAVRTEDRYRSSVHAQNDRGELTALYRVSIDAGMFLGPLVSGLLGLARASFLPLFFATAMTAIAVLLLRHPVADDRSHVARG